MLDLEPLLSSRIFGVEYLITGSVLLAQTQMLTSWVDLILNQNLGKEFYNPKYPSVNWQLRVYPNIWQLDSGDFSNSFFYYYKILAGIYVSLVQVGLNDSKPLKCSDGRIKKINIILKIKYLFNGKRPRLLPAFTKLLFLYLLFQFFLFLKEGFFPSLLLSPSLPQVPPARMYCFIV